MAYSHVPERPGRPWQPGLAWLLRRPELAGQLEWLGWQVGQKPVGRLAEQLRPVRSGRPWPNFFFEKKKLTPDATHHSRFKQLTWLAACWAIAAAPPDPEPYPLEELLDEEDPYPPLDPDEEPYPLAKPRFS